MSGNQIREPNKQKRGNGSPQTMSYDGPPHGMEISFWVAFKEFKCILCHPQVHTTAQTCLRACP